MGRSLTHSAFLTLKSTTCLIQTAGLEWMTQVRPPTPPPLKSSIHWLTDLLHPLIHFHQQLLLQQSSANRLKSQPRLAWIHGKSHQSCNVNDEATPPPLAVAERSSEIRSGNIGTSLLFFFAQIQRSLANHWLDVVAQRPTSELPHGLEGKTTHIFSIPVTKRLFLHILCSLQTFCRPSSEAMRA